MLLAVTALGVWAFFAGYLVWYVTLAKCDVPLTVEDAEVLWKMHKQSANCAGDKWRCITCKSGEVAGFECECGYSYSQKRLLLSRLPKVKQ